MHFRSQLLTEMDIGDGSDVMWGRSFISEPGSMACSLGELGDAGIMKPQLLHLQNGLRITYFQNTVTMNDGAISNAGRGGNTRSPNWFICFLLVRHLCSAHRHGGP